MTTRTIVTAVSLRNTTTGLPDTRDSGWVVRLQYLFEGGGWQDYGKLSERLGEELKSEPDVVFLEPRGGGYDSSNRSSKVYRNQDVLDEWLEACRQHPLLQRAPKVLWLPSFPTDLRFDASEVTEVWRGSNGYTEMNARLANVAALVKKPVYLPQATPLREESGPLEKPLPSSSRPSSLANSSPVRVRPGRG